MSKRLRFALAGLFAAMAAVIVWELLREPEPSFQSKTLGAWLAELDSGKSHSSTQAVAAVKTIGTNAFPWLTNMIRATDPIWRRMVMTMNANQSLIRLPVTPARFVRAQAIEGYTALGSLAKENVPTLIQIMQSETSPQVRACIAAALGGIGPAARAAVPVLQKATQDPNPEVRRSAFFALANIQMWDDPPAMRGILR